MKRPEVEGTDTTQQVEMWQSIAISSIGSHVTSEQMDEPHVGDVERQKKLQ